jgi:RNA polymerase sigma factor (sigma-70 family)
MLDRLRSRQRDRLLRRVWGVHIGGEAQTAAVSAIVDLDGFDRFYTATAPRTLALARSLTRSWADAEDLVQDAYVDAHRRWATVGAFDDPAAWVHRAVVNRSRSRWRRIGRELKAVTRLAGRPADRDHDNQPADDAMWRCVAALPRQQAKVVALFYVDDLSVEQIAALLECSTGTVKTHLFRARATLHAALADTIKEDS